MAVVQIISQLKEDRRLHPPPAVPGNTHGQGDLVHDGKVHSIQLVHQQIGIFPHRVQGLAAVPAIQPQGQGQGQIVGGEEGHQPPHPGLIAEALPDLFGPPGGDSLDLGQLSRILLQHHQAVGPEALDDGAGGGGPHALDHPGGQIVQYLVFLRGHIPLHLMNLHLVPVDRMAHPPSRHHQVLPGRGKGDGPHRRHRLAVGSDQPEDSVAVLLVLINNMGDGPADRAFIHGAEPPPCNQKRKLYGNTLETVNK